MILDTSGLLCLLNKAESLHRRACEAYQATSILLTHSYVVAEFIALANARGLPRKTALNFMVDLLKNPEIETIWVSQTLNDEAVSFLMERQDKRSFKRPGPKLNTRLEDLPVSRCG